MYTLIDTINSLNEALKEAGGVELSFAELANIGALDLVDLISTKDIRFIYLSDIKKSDVNYEVVSYVPLEKHKATHIRLTGAEIQSGLNRQRAAEGLITQLPNTHDGRNTWLLNYGVRAEAIAFRNNYRGGAVKWNDKTESAETVESNDT